VSEVDVLQEYINYFEYSSSFCGVSSSDFSDTGCAFVIACKWTASPYSVKFVRGTIFDLRFRTLSCLNTDDAN